MSSFLSYVGLMGGWGLPMPRARVEYDALEGIDIEAEYALIKEKRSTLSRSLRDRIVWIKEKRDDRKRADD